MLHVSESESYGEPGLVSAVSAAALKHRPARAADHAVENRALNALAQEMAVSPESVLQKLAETAMTMCRAHSAGLSLLEDGDQRKKFHWRAVAGRWAAHLDGETPREFSPCGTVLDRNDALVFSRPERDFPYLRGVTPPLEEALLIPFHVKGEPVGTIWIVSHDETRRFDAEDLRVMTNLGAFAAAAYQNLMSLNATQRLASIVDSSADAIASETLDGTIATWNEGATRLFGYRADEAIGRSTGILIPEDRQDEERTIVERIKRGEAVEHHETVRRRKDGSLIPISLTISPVRNGQGDIVGASKIARDVSDRKRKEDHIALLSHEVNHRSRNMLSLVQAIVRLAQGDTVDGLKKAIAGRIHTLSAVDNLLAESRWTGADIHKLIGDELSPYRELGDSSIVIEGPSLLLKPRSAQSIAIAIHELTTNAAKYGALSKSTGGIRVEWSLATEGALVIVWTEHGGPPVAPPARQGFGTKVIAQIIRGEMNGSAGFDWRPEGLECRIVLDPAVGL